MKRTEPIAVGELLTSIISNSEQMKTGFAESRVPIVWREIVGPLADMTKDIYLRDGVLWVVCESAVVKNEIMMRKSTLISELNNRVGREVVNVIRVKY